MTTLLHIVLYQPEIPPNTGNIARTCAALNATLHLIEPRGFSISDKHLKRAGLDYWDLLETRLHADWATFEAGVLQDYDFATLAMLSTKGSRLYTEIPVRPEVPNITVFGPETRGLPSELLDRYAQHVYRIPMVAEARSLNLSNAAAVVGYDIARRHGFERLK